MIGRATQYICAVFAAACIAVPVAIMAEQKPDTSPAAMMREMRLHWLTDWTQKPKGEGGQNPNKVSAVLMDWPIRDDRIATVIASSGGDASLYTTGTFGIIGGVGHDNVRRAAIALTDDAQRYLALAAPTTDFSYPSKDRIKFFFVLPSGVQSITFLLTDVERPDSAARDLFAHAQQVLAELRSVSEPQGQQH
jgi:hypothetical protein